MPVDEFSSGGAARTGSLPDMKRAFLLVLPAILVVLAGCGSSSSSSSSASTTSSAKSSAAPSGGGTTVKVTMKNVAFNPSSVSAKVGDTVKWVNDDQPPHNVTYVSGPKFTSSGTLNTGDTFSVKLTAPGTIHYVCTIHPFMKATITVTK